MVLPYFLFVDESFSVAMPSKQVQSSAPSGVCFREVQNVADGGSGDCFVFNMQRHWTDPSASMAFLALENIFKFVD